MKLKHLLINLAASFQAADDIKKRDDQRKAWDKVVIDLSQIMRDTTSEEHYKALYSIWQSSQCSNPPLVINAIKWYAETFRPTYKHDCDDCVYHGTKTIDDVVYDFYTCNETVIGRYDNDPPSNLTWSLDDVDNHHVLKYLKDFL